MLNVTHARILLINNLIKFFNFISLPYYLFNYQLLVNFIILDVYLASINCRCTTAKSEDTLLGVFNRIYAVRTTHLQLKKKRNRISINNFFKSLIYKLRCYSLNHKPSHLWFDYLAKILHAIRPLSTKMVGRFENFKLIKTTIIYFKAIAHPATGEY
jgi:hypothetical protein